MKTVFPSFLPAVDRLSWFLLALFTSWIVLGSADTNQTTWPLYSKKPVLFVWNVPTQHCEKEKGVKLSLDQFDIVSNPSKDVFGQNLTTFYKENLGIYPYINLNKTAVNGGLPQSASLSEHLEKMSKDIDQYIPDRKAKGLTVIEWKEWRPVWDRNEDDYKKKSEELVAIKNPKFSKEQVGTVAKQEFERSAREFMLETLRQGKNLRPNKLWGYYGLPECYNYAEIYTGQCSAVEIEKDDQLKWMWNESTALFPAIYRDSTLTSKTEGRLFVQKRVQYAMRLASVVDGLARPVFVYTQLTHLGSRRLLKEDDLVNTVGESVALGAAGVIFWVKENYISKIDCNDLNDYILGDLGRYLLNVTTAAKECSQKLCNFKGRCLRQEPDSTVFLHLSPSTHSIIRQSGKPGSPGEAELKAFRQHFKCQCYNGYWGEGCELKGQGGTDETEEIEEIEETEEREEGEKGEREEREELYLCSATSVLGMWPLCFVLQLGLLSLFH